jgi:hypothetical protein
MLTKALINRDISITMEDAMSHIVSIEKYINSSYSLSNLSRDFDYEKFFSGKESNKEYIKFQIQKYESIIGPYHAFNALDIFANAPHMFQYQRALATAHYFFKDINAYQTAWEVNRIETILSKKKATNSDLIFYNYSTDNFTEDYDLIHGLYIHSYLNERNTSSITSQNLGDYNGRLAFIREVNVSLPALKAKYPNNKLVKDLVLTSDADGTRMRINDFFDMTEEMKSTYIQEMAMLDTTDRKRLFVYNLIINRDKVSKGALTNFFSVADKLDYINFLDYEVNVNPEIVYQIKQLDSPLPEFGIPYSPAKMSKKQSKRILDKSKYKRVDVHSIENFASNKLREEKSDINVVEGKPVIEINNKAILIGFVKKDWMNPVVLSDGTKTIALPADAFTTPEEYKQYILEFRYLAFKNKNKNAYDLTIMAMNNLGKKSFVLKQTDKELEKQQLKFSIPIK